MLGRRSWDDRLRVSMGDGVALGGASASDSPAYLSERAATMRPAYLPAPSISAGLEASLAGQADAGEDSVMGAMSSRCSPLSIAPMQVKNTFIHVAVPPSITCSQLAEEPKKWTTAPAIVQAGSFQMKYISSEEAHERGECKPCAYHVYKQDGCRQGDSCEFCHLCTRAEIKRRKKERSRLMKSQIPGAAAEDAKAIGGGAPSGSPQYHPASEGEERLSMAKPSVSSAVADTSISLSGGTPSCPPGCQSSSQDIGSGRDVEQLALVSSA